jgi:glyoxylase-like metal-dependent hydrolase (beta-lactamase superfamily II)
MIGPNIWAAIDDANDDAGAIAGFVVGDSGVVVIDTFKNEAVAKALLGQIQTITHLPIKFVVNTHYHIDHAVGNRVFSTPGAVIVAHQNVGTWINSENPKFFGDKIKPEEKTFIEHQLGSEVAYDSELSLFLEKRRVDIKFFPGHTLGDSIVSIPDAGVVFCGNRFWRKTLPNLIDATTGTWIRTLSEIPAIPSQGTNAMIFAPGHRGIGDGGAVQDLRQYLEFPERSHSQKTLDSGKTGDDLVAVVLPQLTQTYGSWDFFKNFSRSDILDVAAELKAISEFQFPTRNEVLCWLRFVRAGLRIMRLC